MQSIIANDKTSNSYFNVVETFYSIEGEGKRSGLLCSFIRFAGCNLRCSYCDTQYAQEHSVGKRRSLKELLDFCEKNETPFVTLTGGEPLLQDNINELVYELSRNKYEVNIETNGAVSIESLEQYRNNNVFFTIDYKLPSSNMVSKMIEANYNLLTENDIVKFVVGCEEDLDWMREFIRKHEKRKFKIYVSAVWGKIALEDIVEYMKKWSIADCRLQLQIHKIIWNENVRGV